MRYFCPWCGLELKGNYPKASHIDDNAAWCISECEYEVGATSIYGSRNTPVSEEEKMRNTIKVMKMRRKQLMRDIKREEMLYQELLVREGLVEELEA